MSRRTGAFALRGPTNPFGEQSRRVETISLQDTR
jgi:hypothetical protein